MRFDERGEALDALGERCDGLLEREDVDGRWAARLIGVDRGRRGRGQRRDWRGRWRRLASTRIIRSDGVAAAAV